MGGLKNLRCRRCGEVVRVDEHCSGVLCGLCVSLYADAKNNELREAAAEMRCENHPRYRGKAAPRTSCKRCLEIFKTGAL